MTKKESKFQKEMIDAIKKKYPGCIAIKNDPNYIQGFPDWTILYQDKWAVLEAKASEHSSHRPNQDYYVNKLNDMSFSRFIYPENEEHVLQELEKIFGG